MPLRFVTDGNLECTLINTKAEKGVYLKKIIIIRAEFPNVLNFDLILIRSRLLMRTIDSETITRSRATIICFIIVFIQSLIRSIYYSLRDMNIKKIVDGSLNK